MSSNLILEDGRIFEGLSFGSKNTVTGEVVFNTSMVGYPEALTDPSYKNQILILTYPCVGNYGVPPYTRNNETNILEYFESEEIHILGLIIADYCENHSHWNSNKTLSNWMKEFNIPGLYNVDTRQLTKIIREEGVMIGRITSTVDDLSVKLNMTECNLVKAVSRKSIQEFNSGKKYNILVIDCGIKNNIIRKLLKYDDIMLTVVPYDFNMDYDKYDGIFISNGPGNPEDCIETINYIKKFIDNRVNKPLFGICLGNQLLGLAAGASTVKLKYGNRGVNQPVIDLKTKKCYITSQNHGYVIDMNTLTDEWLPYFINANDYSNEGIIHQSLPYFGVQFHPEACGGPSDSDYLFDMFISKIKQENYTIIDKYFGSYQEIKNREIRKILLLGSGGLSIGQAGEFDYSGTQAIKALKEENIEVILINPNIATVQTSNNLADKIYYLSVNMENVEHIIKTDKPDAIMINFGGQTALNCGIEMYNNGIFDKYNVKILGTSINSIVTSEDRESFSSLMDKINEPVAKKYIVRNEEQINKAIEYIGFPMILRNGFALGGLGSCFVYNELDLKSKIINLLKTMDYVLVEQSIKGWKEIEYEIVRDYNDNCIAVCNMENFDPLGVHTGDSIVVAPSQTLSNNEYYKLRYSAIKIAKELKIVGECNVQFALDPLSDKYIVIELNPRLSRSSALASKATGYPLAYIAAKILLGKNLTDLRNSVTKKTTACYEPSLDYVVVKIPKWEFLKFKHVNKLLDSSMKSVGEVMAIGRNFEETIQKAMRMVDDSNYGFYSEIEMQKDDLVEQLKNPSFNRIFLIAKAFDLDYTVDTLYDLTKIDKWFLHKLYNIHKMKQYLYNTINIDTITPTIVKQAKALGLCDKLIGKLINTRENIIRNYRHKHQILPSVKQIDTTAGEYPAETNYLYLTYNGSSNDVEFDNNGIMVLGCGSYKIGSSVEFDWCAVSCINALKKNKKYTIVVNYNPETVSTDYDVSDRLYFEEISLESIIDIYSIECSEGVIVSVGGQIPNNLALELYNNNINILGTNPYNIDRAEDRHKFSQLLDTINVDQPLWKEMSNLSEAYSFCEKVSYPVLIRPSYVLSGAAMKVANNKIELEDYLNLATEVSNETPVVISKFITNAKEIEVDAIGDNGKLVNYVISEHLENAGIHSGDATIILPAQKLYLETTKRIKKVCKNICSELNISGPFNIQFISKENEIKVIECNLRASRSFPFVSKTFNTNLIEIATNIMIKKKYTPASIKIDDIDYVSIKVPVFSFNRLPNVDPVLGVEMVSTGEVASFGYDVKETYIKALMSSGFKLPKQNILISIGEECDKYSMLHSVQTLIDLNYTIYCTTGTYSFFNEKKMNVNELEFETIINYLENDKIDLLINIPTNLYSSNNNTNGFIIRRKCIDYNIPLITNIKCAKLFVSSLKNYLNGRIKKYSWHDYIL